MHILKQTDLFTNRLFHSDIEARGFLDVVKTASDVWCLVLKDNESKRVFLFHDYPQYDEEEVEDNGVVYTIPTRDGDLLTGIRFLYLAGTNGSKIAMHNLQTYDRPLIEKIWSKCILPEEAYIDTFIQSKVLWFDRPCPKGAKSPHGLDGYAKLSGETHKPKVVDFSIMNAFMLHRCIMDVDIQEFCTNYLDREQKTLKLKLGIDFTEALIMENLYAQSCQRQETYGAMVDLPHMLKCVEDWDKRLVELEETIVPLLPPTVKTTGSKVSRKEMAVLMGYPKETVDRMKEIMITKKLNGEMVTIPHKVYANPSVNYTRVAKTNQYSGLHPSYGFSPSYIKKKDLTDWIKDNHPDTKPKDWDIEKELIEATLLNKNCCDYFGVNPEDTDLISGMHTRVKFVASGMTQHEVTKGFLIKSGIKWVNEWNFKKDDNGFVKADHDMVISYPPKAAPENQLHYSVKKGEPIVTSPKIGEKEYEQLENEDGRMVGEYNTTIHRRRFLQIGRAHV